MTSPLPADFTPSPDDVVIGKGKKFYYHPGNAMLRQYVTDRLDEYSNATTKIAKSNIITNVVDAVREKGKFVKLDPEDNKTWLVAEDLLCREKCSACFRETLRNNDSAQRLAKLGSSSDLIHALKMTKISSGNNLHRVAMSTGNLLVKRPSQGQFSAAKKASFNRLQNAGLGIATGGGGGAKNATWSPKVRANKPGVGVDNRQLRGLLTNFRTNSQRKLASGQNHQPNPFLNGGLLGQQDASPMMVGSSPNGQGGMHPMMVQSGGGNPQGGGGGHPGFNGTQPSILERVQMQQQQQQQQVQQMQQQQQQQHMQQQHQYGDINLEPTPIMEPTPIREGLKQFENQMSINNNNVGGNNHHPGAIQISPDPISPATEKLLTQPMDSLLNGSDNALPELDIANDPLLASTLEGVNFGGNNNNAGAAQQDANGNNNGSASKNSDFDALLDMPIMEVGEGNNTAPISNEHLEGFAW